MWLLIQERDILDGGNPLPVTSAECGIAKWGLLPGKTYSIGKRGCDITNDKDVSLSKKHAVIKVFINESSSDSKPEVILEDIGSKFGTYLNDEVLKHVSSQVVDNASKVVGIQRDRRLRKPTKLVDSDRMQFGLSKSSIFRLKWIPLKVTSSMLKEKPQVNAHLKAINPHYSLQNEWTMETTHLVMRKISLSAKVVNCLAKIVPIVTPEYFRDYLTALNSKQRLPEPDCYVPDISPAETESQLRAPGISFKLNFDRKTLFKDKTFVFFSEEQLKELKDPIRLCGGKSEVWNPDTMNRSGLVQPNSILVQARRLKDTQSQVIGTVAELYEHLEKHDLQPVPQLHIYLAIVHANIQTYCNPSRPKVSLLSRGGSHESMRVVERKVHVPETQLLGTEKSNQRNRGESTSTPLHGSTTASQAQEATQLLDSCQPTVVLCPESNTKSKAADGGDAATNKRRGAVIEDASRANDSDKRGRSSARSTPATALSTPTTDSGCEDRRPPRSPTRRWQGDILSKKRTRSSADSPDGDADKDDPGCVRNETRTKKPNLGVASSPSSRGKDKQNHASAASRKVSDSHSARTDASDDSDEETFAIKNTIGPTQSAAKPNPSPESSKENMSTNSVIPAHGGTSLKRRLSSGSQMPIDKRRNTAASETADDGDDIFNFGSAKPRPTRRNVETPALVQSSDSSSRGSRRLNSGANSRDDTKRDSEEEEDDIFGFGGGCKEGNRAKSSKIKDDDVPVVEFEDSVGLPEASPLPPVIKAEIADTTTSSTENRSFSMDDDGFVGKDSFVKEEKIAIKKEDPELSNLSKSLCKIIVADLYRPSMSHSETMMSCSSNTFDRSGSNFKKFKKQRVVRPQDTVELVRYSTPANQSRIEQWFANNQEAARVIHSQEADEQESQKIWNFLDSQNRNRGTMARARR